MIYLALLLMAALLGGVAALGLRVVQTQQTRLAELELLAIGLEFRHALQSYAAATPDGSAPAPAALEELLRDSRSGGIVRHLRQIYHDPLTGRASWGLLRGADQRIVGVHSLSDTPTFKQDGFPAEVVGLEGKTRHREWVFSAVDPAAGKDPGSPAPTNPNARF